MIAGNKTGHQRYNDIIEAAKHLFDTKGFDHTTCKDITKRIGMSDVELLGYFDSLDEILEVIWSES